MDEKGEGHRGPPSYDTVTGNAPKMGFSPPDQSPQRPPFNNQGGYIPLQTTAQGNFNAQQPQNVVVTQLVVGQPQFGPHPQLFTCPSCGNTKATRMEFQPDSRTHIIAVLLCVFGLCCCACIPYCIDSCQRGNHYCSECNAYVGSHVR